MVFYSTHIAEQILAGTRILAHGNCNGTSCWRACPAFVKEKCSIHRTKKIKLPDDSFETVDVPPTDANGGITRRGADFLIAKLKKLITDLETSIVAFSTYANMAREKIDE